MKRLYNKQILLGISGSIAAYKACNLLRYLQSAGAQVRVVMTQAATEFVTPMTFQALSGHMVYRELLDENAEAAMGHIELARWADAVVVVPASANFIARLAQGQANDLLTTLCLATPAVVAVAPAMNQQMWLDAATQSNIAILKQRHIAVLGPASGDQACGDIGPGRMLEPEVLLTEIAELFSTGLLAGLTAVVTAGPTREAIDPVRYLSNRSSGKMGYALAQALVEAGAACTLISGPTYLAPPYKVSRIDVESAQQMHRAAMKFAGNCDLFVAAAAVADYRPTTLSEQKIKKSKAQIVLKLSRNPDVLADVAAAFPAVFTVGFAAETQYLQQNALAKLKNKSLGMIVANNVSSEGVGFDSDNNEVSIYWPDGKLQLSKASKTQIARQIVSIIADVYRVSGKAGITQ
ncbi:MAG: bifunctional phosphopantothenoylcysteine decarboxylase/phosphopantothenate--cysteine ligase CoaBC [Gammaproteobacteria bacterium]|nr:bifunctional phosphopantothenoylcysteine decarboxylase/phosphopantothenate--cysteine ligase CoaBC [Gammaproteobacteria bacterium]